MTSFSIPQGSLGFWIDRLKRYGVEAGKPRSRFAEESITFHDPDGLRLELVAHAGGEQGGFWAGAAAAGEHAIRGIHSTTLTERSFETTLPFLTETMGLRLAAEAQDRARLESATPDQGGRIDILLRPKAGMGRIAAGTVHHVAWRVPDDRVQAAWRERLIDRGFQPTEVLDRRYFKSIYFREPGGVLFEFATDRPGFTRDEAPAELGKRLTLPPWLEADRDRIEGALPPVQLPQESAGVNL